MNEKGFVDLLIHRVKTPDKDLVIRGFVVTVGVPEERYAKASPLVVTKERVRAGEGR